MTFAKWMKEFERKDYPVILASGSIDISVLMNLLGADALVSAGATVFAVCCILLSIRNELKELCELLAGECEKEF